VLREYAWSHEGCGQPCATEPFALTELLSLGGDVFERAVPDEEKNPKPPELTKDEKELDKEILKAIKKPKERRERQKMMEDDRKKIAAVKALVERHKYVLARLHYRYDDKSLTRDPKLEAAPGALEGGIALPKGQKREANLTVGSGKENRLQTRFNNFHTWKPVIKCPSPERFRWGKSPPDYRGLRKTWLADDLTRKSRTQMPAEKMLLTSIPELKLGPGFAVADAGADAADAGDAAGSAKSCGCRVVGAPFGSPLGAGLAALLGLGLVARRRRS
jgi:MYXO-CTERM domain-containing protein